MTALSVGERLKRPVDREDFVDMDAYHSFVNQLGQTVEVLCIGNGHLAHCRDAAFLGKRFIGASSEAHQNSALLEHLDRLCRCVPSNQVEDGGEILEVFVELLLMVIDDNIGPEFFHERNVLLADGRRDLCAD